MPTTDPTTSNIGIVSLSPNLLSRTRSFTAMSNFTPITFVNFEFGPHHSFQLAYLHTALNNAYSEPLEDTTLSLLFIDVNRTAINVNEMDLLRSTILETVVNNNRADLQTIEPLLKIAVPLR